MLQKPKLFSRAFMVSNKMMMSTTIKLDSLWTNLWFYVFPESGSPRTRRQKNWENYLRRTEYIWRESGTEAMTRRGTRLSTRAGGPGTPSPTWWSPTPSQTVIQSFLTASNLLWLFSDQLDWTLDEIGKVWMRNKRERFDNKEYVWKVLLSECFIKFYMDWFAVSKQDAELMIKETPLRNEEDNSSGDW